jgi:hypothetical protein
MDACLLTDLCRRHRLLESPLKRWNPRRASAPTGDCCPTAGAPPTETRIARATKPMPTDTSAPAHRAWAPAPRPGLIVPVQGGDPQQMLLPDRDQLLRQDRRAALLPFVLDLNLIRPSLNYGRRPRTKNTTATMRPTTNRIQAMFAEVPAIPLKPSTAATRAMIKNTAAQ